MLPREKGQIRPGKKILPGNPNEIGTVLLREATKPLTRAPSLIREECPFEEGGSRADGRPGNSSDPLRGHGGRSI
ncbi:hypothetical protein MASR2M79_16380 [Aminivibrio sp.]